MTSAIAAPDRDHGRHIPLAALTIFAAVVLYTQLQAIGDFVAFRLFGLSGGSRLGSAVAFFAFEVPKVLLLLTGVVFVVGVLRSFVTPERARQVLAGRREASGNVLAAMFGVVTPFCSCSAVPLFIGFVTAGVPLGVTFSFLIAAPMVNEVALVLLFGLFGWKVAAIYLGTGLGIAIIAGWTLGRLRLERYVEPWVWEIQSHGTADVRRHWRERIAEGRAAMGEIVGKVWLYVVIGIGVGAGIHGYVATDLITSIMGRDAWWSVPLAVLLGVPMYANAAGVIPVVQALLGKGAALGTVLAFMMSVTALSLPEMVILRRVLRPRLIVIFVAIVAAGILCVGYIFNTIL
ncbi:MAG TPA: permease [Thermoanaerobaculia bacterium]|nr:permease [Thermoanaerobaculia bacterium]